MAFHENYSEYYNLFYKDKDYKGESEYIHQLISSNGYTDKENISILDLACGTGRHVFELDKMGYKVEGSDIASDMINIAQNQALEMGRNIKFHNYSFQSAHKIQKKYDVIISMFSAVNYITEHSDLLLTLNNIRGLLKDNGIFIFDYWNGNAVVRDYSPVKVLRKKSENGEILRVSETQLNLFEQVASVKFTCMFLKDNVKTIEFEEIHRMRYFYFKELENILNFNGFEIAHKSSFKCLDEICDPFEWNVSIVARKVS